MTGGTSSCDLFSSHGPRVIRRALDTDVEAVVAIFADWPGHGRGQMLFSRLDDWHVHLVAELAGQVLGYASLTPEGWSQDQYSETEAMGDNWGFLADIVVARDHRSQGVGEELVRSAVQEARTAGARGLAVNPDSTGDRHRLFKFYERNGFEPVCPRAEPDWPYYYLSF